MTTLHEKSALNLAQIVSGSILIILFGVLWYISPEFLAGIELRDTPVIQLVIIMLSAGAVYLICLGTSLTKNTSRNYFLWILAVGIVMRLFMIASVPMLEDDYFRYLWDGGVTVSGVNPYSHSPESVLQNSGVPGQLSELSEKAGETVERINNPSVRTIYPPLAQAAFALSYVAGPFDLITWKIILLIFDFITLALLFYILKEKKLPSSYLLIYWWNPLLVKEIFNSAHLDVMVFPFVLGGLLLASRDRRIGGALSIVLGIGVKLWPAFILPVILRPLLSQPKRLIDALILIGVLMSAFFVPVYLSGLDQTSGFIAYGERWQNNDSIFRGLILLSEVGLKALGYETFHKYALARVLAAALIILWLLFITFSKRFEVDDQYKKSLFIIAFVFLISPTQFPWYYTWLLPLLAVTPRFSLLLPTLLLPLYYLRYYLEPLDRLELFTNFVVWVEFVPVWIFLILEWKYGHKKVSPINFWK